MPSAAREALLDLMRAAGEWQRVALPTKATGDGESIDSMVSGYLDDLTRDFLDVLDKTLSAPAAERQHRGYVENLAEPAFDAGMEAGGADPSEKDDADEQAINDWISEQEQSIGGLWDDIRQLRTDKPDLSDDDFASRERGIMGRLGLWADKLRELAGLGKVGPLGNQTVTWKYGDTVDHCDVCEKLNGQKHRLKWFTDKGYIPQERGSDTLTCGGWRCQCVLEDGDGNVILPA